ncbi:hypothetical protein [Blastopirellula marina]|nr:hypothetical protein [Blastopirellula marina]
MQKMSKAIRFAALLAVCCITQTAYSQDVQLGRDEQGEVISARYGGKLGFRATRLRQFPRLETLYVDYGLALTADDLDYLATLSSLQEIEFGFAGVSSEYVTINADLAPLAKLTQLRSLVLCKEKMQDDDLKFVAALPRLEYLEFNGDTNPEGEKGPAVTDRAAEYLGKAPALKHLIIEGFPTLSDKFVDQVTAGVPGLEHFDVTSPAMTDESLRMLAERCERLRWLDMSVPQVTDDGVRHLAAAKNLEMLWIDSPQLTKDCVAAVAELKKLRHLELTVPTIDDQDVGTLVALPQLEILALRRPPLTDQQFAKFRQHAALESAFLNGRQLSKEETLQTVAALPRLRHLTLYGNERLQAVVGQVLAARRPATD